MSRCLVIPIHHAKVVRLLTFLTSKSGGVPARFLVRCLELAVLSVLPFMGLHAAAQSNAPVQAGTG